MAFPGQLTCGVAIDVPDMIASTLSPVCHALTMLAPGAKVKRQGPTLLKVARASVLVLAPTTMASGADEGLKEQAFPPLLLPAAATTLMLRCVHKNGLVTGFEGGRFLYTVVSPLSLKSNTWTSH